MSSIEVEDVLPLLQQAAQRCLDEDSPMLASESFSLHDSMSAVTIMDPKMDPCYRLSCSSFEAFVKREYEGSGEVDSMKVAMVMEELLVREVAFFDGASLLESLHHGLHMWPETWRILDESSHVGDKWLSTYCQGTEACSSLVLSYVMRANIFEDDDFQFQSTPSAVFSQGEMEDIFQKSQVFAEPSDQMDDYVRFFFKYRVLVYRMFSEIDKFVEKTFTMFIPHAQSSLQNPDSEKETGEYSLFEETLRSSLATVYSLAREIFQVTGDIGCLAASRPLANEEQKHFLLKSFQKSLMNLRQTSPAREFPLVSFKESILYVQDMCEDFMCMCQSLNTMFFNTEKIDIDTIFQWFASFSRNKSNILVRSYLVAAWSAVKNWSPKLLENSCTRRGIPESLLDIIIRTEWQQMSFSLLLWDTIRLLTVHRNKIHALGENIIKRWGNFVNDAQHVDMSFSNHLRADGDGQNNEMYQSNHQPWFGMWALSMTASVMDLYMELFVELDLLAHSELSSFYWYWDYILSTRAYALKALRELRHGFEVQLHELDVKQAKDAFAKAKSAGGGKKNKKAINAAKAAYSSMLAKPAPTPSPHSIEEIYLVLRGQFNKALFRFYLALEEDGAINKLGSMFSSPDLIFLNRYRVILSMINPQPVSYQDFLATKRDSSSKSLEPVELFSSAEAMLQTSKPLLEKASVTLSEGRTGASDPSRFPRCVCRSARPALAKLPVLEKFPDPTLSKSDSRPLASSVHLDDMAVIHEGLAKVSVALSIACKKQIRRLTENSPMKTSAVRLDRKFSDCFPVPSME